MQKRERKPAEAKRLLDEPLFQVGVTISYYDEGWRYGHITEVDIDDDGDLFITLQPLIKNPLRKPKQLSFKAKDLKVV